MLSLVSYYTFKSIKITAWKITKADKNMVIDLDYESKIIARLNKKVIFALMYFAMKVT